jgi:formylmethanofuran dehydrogenase subunit E
MNKIKKYLIKNGEKSTLSKNSINLNPIFKNNNKDLYDLTFIKEEFFLLKMKINLK